MTNYILGIDPGNQGAIALLASNRELLGVFDLPVVAIEKRRQISAPLVFDLVAHTIGNLVYGAPLTAFVEKVGVMPKEGAVGAFTFGRGVGVLEGVLACQGVSVERAPPNQWKAQMGLTGKQKKASRALVIEKYPGMAHHFARVKDDGRAEAVLIGLWGLRKMERGR